MLKQFHAYILRCADGTYYVGHTDDLDVRMAQHVEGTYPGYTSKRRPVELVWAEGFATRDEAKVAEHRLKGWRREKKEALIRGETEHLPELASRSRRPDTGQAR